MLYILVFVVLLGSLLIYFKIADRLNIVDKPNERSSHKSLTIRGGGVVFPLGVLLWYLLWGFQSTPVVLGLLLIATISFLDDRYNLSTRPRLLVHFLSVGLLLYGLGIFEAPYYWWFVASVLIIGWINAFNFMDGINGITVFYTLAILLPMLWINQTQEFVSDSILLVMTIASTVFAFFNARKRARTFAGDVGSVSLAFVIAFLLTRLMMVTGQWAYILFVAVYGIDSVLTIAQRLLRGENIFKAHRSHLYQYLANEYGWSHLRVSLMYATIQLALSILAINLIWNEAPPVVFIALLLSLGALYLVVKRRILKGLQLRPSRP